MNPTGIMSPPRGAPAWAPPTTPRVAGRCPYCTAFVPDVDHEVWCPLADPEANPADEPDEDPDPLNDPEGVIWVVEHDGSRWA